MRQTQFFVILGLFLPFYHHNNWENQNFTKLKRSIWRFHHFTHVPKITIIWCMLPNIWNMTDIIFLSFWAIIYPLTLLTWKIKVLKKNKKTTGDIIISHKCTINDNHMMYDSWDKKCNRWNFLSSWAIFCPFTPLTTQKIKMLKNWKHHLEISSFYICVPKIMIRWYMVSEIWCVTDVIVISHLGYFLPF